MLLPDAAEPVQQNIMDIDDLQSPDTDTFDFSDLDPDTQSFNDEGVLVNPSLAKPAEPEPVTLEPKADATPEPEPTPTGPPPKWEQYGFKSLEEYNHAVELQNAELQGRLAGTQSQPRPPQPSVDEVVAAQEAKLISRLKKTHGMPDGGEGFVQEILAHARGESEYRAKLQEQRYQQEIDALRGPMNQVFDRLSIMQEAPPEVQKAQEEAIYIQDALVAAGLSKKDARGTASTLIKNILQKNAAIATAATGATPTPTPTAPVAPSPNLKVVASRPKMPSADEAAPDKGGDDSDFITNSKKFWNKMLGSV